MPNLKDVEEFSRQATILHSVLHICSCWASLAKLGFKILCKINSIINKICVCKSIIYEALTPNMIPILKQRGQQKQNQENNSIWLCKQIHYNTPFIISCHSQHMNTHMLYTGKPCSNLFSVQGRLKWHYRWRMLDSQKLCWFLPLQHLGQNMFRKN